MFQKGSQLDECSGNGWGLETQQWWEGTEPSHHYPILRGSGLGDRFGERYSLLFGNGKIWLVTQKLFCWIFKHLTTVDRVLVYTKRQMSEIMNVFFSQRIMYQGSCERIVTIRMDTCAHVVVPNMWSVPSTSSTLWQGWCGIPGRQSPSQREGCLAGMEKAVQAIGGMLGCLELRLLKEISFVNESWCQNHL